jgi:hypothetical protein
MNKSSFITKTLTAAVLAAVSSMSFAAGEVQYLASGVWGDGIVVTGNGFGYEARNFWVDAKVQNLAYNKVVGVRWTDNNWATYTNSAASYELTNADGTERWGVDVKPAGWVDYTRFGNPTWKNVTTGAVNSIPTGGQKIKFAIYYTVNGVTYWDNNNGQNYELNITNP